MSGIIDILSHFSDDGSVRYREECFALSDERCASKHGCGNLSKIYNDAIGAVLKKYPDRFIGAGILPPENVTVLTSVLNRFFDVSACRGKMMMAGVFDRYPTVKYIFVHYGGVLPILSERFDNT